jgi:uncharacterized protein YbjT (DUF2867 family)
VILVTGASGFVGGHVVRGLAGAGEAVRALVRGARSAAVLEGVDCELARGDVTDPASLRAAVAGCTAVVHLVSILTGRPADFERVMTKGTASLLEAAGDAGVARFVQMSALGTSEQTKDTVPYYRAKWAMEEAVRASGLSHAILRPSFVFASDGGALPQFARIAKLAPVTPVIGNGTQRLQPIWADDPSLRARAAAEPSGHARPVAHASTRGQHRLRRRREHERVGPRRPAAARRATSARYRSSELSSQPQPTSPVPTG